MKPARPDDIPTATHSGVWKFGDMEITVYQLDDGRRVIDAADMKKVLNWIDGGTGEMRELLDQIARGNI